VLPKTKEKVACKGVGMEVGQQFRIWFGKVNTLQSSLSKKQ
jgi:hypothetical protein